METQLSYSEIQVNGQYKIGSRQICIIDKHVVMILNRDTDGPSTYEERIIYWYLDSISTHISTPFKNVVITY